MRPFNFFDAYLHLHQLPKFDPLTSTSPTRNDDDDSTSGGSAYALVASTLKRPQGLKRAKAERREENEIARIETERNKHLRTLSMLMKTMSNSYTKKIQHEHHMEMFQSLSKIGMTDKAQKHLDAMQSMVKVNGKQSEDSKMSEDDKKEINALGETVCDQSKN